MGRGDTFKKPNQNNKVKRHFYMINTIISITIFLHSCCLFLDTHNKLDRLQSRLWYCHSTGTACFSVTRSLLPACHNFLFCLYEFSWVPFQLSLQLHQKEAYNNTAFSMLSLISIAFMYVFLSCNHPSCYSQHKTPHFCIANLHKVEKFI